MTLCVGRTEPGGYLQWVERDWLSKFPKTVNQTDSANAQLTAYMNSKYFPKAEYVRVPYYSLRFTIPLYMTTRTINANFWVSSATVGYLAYHHTSLAAGSKSSRINTGPPFPPIASLGTKII